MGVSMVCSVMGIPAVCTARSGQHREGYFAGPLGLRAASPCPAFALGAGDAGHLAGRFTPHLGHRPPALLLPRRALRATEVGGLRKLEAAKQGDGGQDSRLLPSFPTPPHQTHVTCIKGLAFAWGARAALRDLVFFLAEIAARATKRLRHLVASLAVAIALSAPLSASAISVCIPVPTPSGIARLCVDVGEPSPESQRQMPEHVNAQRTPSKSEGNILSRAGIRPLQCFSDAHAKIKAVASHRLELIHAHETGAMGVRREPGSTGPARRQELLGKGVDAVALKYGDANTPRSVIIADQIDPVIVMTHMALAGELSQH